MSNVRRRFVITEVETTRTNYEVTVHGDANWSTAQWVEAIRDKVKNGDFDYSETEDTETAWGAIHTLRSELLQTEEG